MKTLLIGINAKYIHPAMALYQLKANTSYETKILEFTIKQPLDTIYCHIEELLKEEKISLIGFSCYLWNIDIILKLSNIIKQNFPNIKILLGGPEVGFDAKHFLTNHPEINYIIRGEGENSFHELCMYLDNSLPLKEVSNLSYLDDFTYVENTSKVPDLSKIKLATLDIEDIENRIIYLESGRGCPYKCSYCTASLDNKVRFFDLDKVIEIVRILMKKQVKIIKFLDRTFNANMKYMMQILDIIDEENICTTFQFEIVVEKLNQEVIDRISKMRQKCLRFEIGIQSTNDIVNEAVCRRQNMLVLEKNIKLLSQTNKVDLHVDLIAGLPLETKESFINSFNKVYMYRAKELQLGFLKFLRGTALMNDIKKHEFHYDQKPPYEVISNKYMTSYDLDEIRLVEKTLELYSNSSKFQNTFNYLFNNNLINNPYQFFLNISKNLHHSQLYDLFIHIDNYFKDKYSNDYNTLHFELIKDYLENHKTKPKIWWEYKITKPERKELYEYIITKLDISIDDLYKHSIVYKNDTINKIYIIIYQNLTFKSYVLSNT